MTVTTDLERLRSTGLKALLAIGASSVALAMAPAAFAQDADEEEADEDRIVVTGSRIQNAGLTSSSPITTVGRAELSLSNTVNSEQFLNTLPQTIPGFDSSSNNPGTGEATVDLRGLGANRTLVLVNGRRYVTSSQTAAVDLNTIPTALVENVEILTGGASAIYGSDAMAGVVNFTLRDDFEGLEFDNSYEISEQGDADIFNTSLTFGSNFDDGRGNIVFNMGYTNRKSLFQADRDEAFFTLNDVGTGFSETGSVNVPSTFVFDTSQSIDYSAILGINPDNPGQVLTRAQFEAGGVLTCPTEGTQEARDIDNNGTPLDNTDDIITGLGYCTTDSFGAIFTPNGAGVDVFINGGPNNNRYNYAPVNYLQLPQERYTLFTSGRYEFSDMVEFYGQAIFVSSQTEQLLAPTPVFTTITVNVDNPFLAGDTEALLLIDQLGGGGDADGNGVADAQLVTGRRFQELGGRSSYLNSNSFQAQGGVRGDLSDSWAYDVFGSFAQNNVTITQTGNVNVPNYQAAVRNGTLNIFDEGAIDQSGALQIFQTGNITGQSEQTVLSGALSGTDFGLASPLATDGVSVAVGVEYREERLSSIGAGLGPDVAGFNQAPDIAGAFDVTEFFGEVNAPIIQGAPFVEDLTFTGAYRYSDYSTVGGVTSYAAGLSWTPVEGVRIRGQFQEAVRAPNIIELFQPQVNGFPNVEDPCSSGNGSFDEISDAATLAAVTANCEADGVPSAAVGTNLQANAQIEGLFGGNPDLDEETAETFTVGLVLEPAFVPSLVITVDYYQIEIEDVIGTVPSQTIFDLCYVEGVSSFCGQIDRLPGGSVDIFTAINQNNASLTTEGIDVSIDYSLDLGGLGTFSVYSLANFTMENAFQALPTEASVDCAGVYGGSCGEPIPEYSFNTRFDWNYGDFGARLRWQHIAAVDDQSPAGLFVPGVDAYNQVDLTVFYQASDNVFLSAGIENLMNTDYVLIGDASAQQSNTYPATYDTIGRTFFGRVVLEF